MTPAFAWLAAGAILAVGLLAAALAVHELLARARHERLEDEAQTRERDDAC